MSTQPKTQVPPHDDDIGKPTARQGFTHNPTGPTELVDLHNPTPAARIIHDGIDGSHKPIVIKSGETVRDVTISKMIADELRARVKPRGRERSDLLVMKPGTTPPPPEATPTQSGDDVDDGK